MTVDYATANGTRDRARRLHRPRTGTLTFTPGQIFKTFTVPIVNDSLDEIDETFLVNLSARRTRRSWTAQAVGTITDNDPLPTLSIDDVTVLEGDAGRSLRPSRSASTCRAAVR